MQCQKFWDYWEGIYEPEGSILYLREKEGRTQFENNLPKIV